MGSIIELNDTLKIPASMVDEPLKLNKCYSFCLNDLRLFNLAPVRVFLVLERNGKWDYIGHALVQKQTIDTVKKTTTGTFLISQLYSENYRAKVNKFESPLGKGFQL